MENYNTTIIYDKMPRNKKRCIVCKKLSPHRGLIEIGRSYKGSNYWKHHGWACSDECFEYFKLVKC